MWRLNCNINWQWFENNNEYVLFSEEAGETLLLNHLGYLVIQWMQQNPQSALSLKEELPADLLQALIPFSREFDVRLAIDQLLQTLLRKHLAVRVEP